MSRKGDIIRIRDTYGMRYNTDDCCFTALIGEGKKVSAFYCGNPIELLSDLAHLAGEILAETSDDQDELFRLGMEFRRRVGDEARDCWRQAHPDAHFAACTPDAQEGLLN